MASVHRQQVTIGVLAALLLFCLAVLVFVRPRQTSLLTEENPIRPITVISGSFQPVVQVAIAKLNENDDQWMSYGGDPGGKRFSRYTDINRSNVSRLKLAWNYHTGDVSKPATIGGFEATPVYGADTLFLSTPHSLVIALDASTGKMLWTADPHNDNRIPWQSYTSRGVALWRDPAIGSFGLNAYRVLFGTFDGRLIELSALSGQPVVEFGDHGQINLKAGLGPMLPWEYHITSPPIVVGNTVIVGSSISDNQRVNSPSGVVRAYDVRTGKPLWHWDPVPRDKNDAARKTWWGNSADVTGSANAWSIMSADVGRDIVYIPTGSPANDYYGGTRLGDNLYANCVVALRASTGQLLWHFQAVHHDIWDYDIPAQPLLFDFRRGNAQIPAVAIATKMGNLFILDRLTGHPLVPITEIPTAKSGVTGEEVSATQPFPPVNYRLVSQKLTEDDAWGLTDESRIAARKWIAELDHGSIFTPPSERGTIIFPGLLGGMNWSGLTYDPQRNLLITTTSRRGLVVTLIKRELNDQISRRLSGAFENSTMEGTPYRVANQWMQTTDGVPMIKPPWGTLLAIDLSTGIKHWERPIGVIPALRQNPNASIWGSPVRGGTIATASGLVFCAGTADGEFRAVDTATGKTLWSTALSGIGNATPMTYKSARTGVQYVVICSGQPGDSVNAYALPSP